MHQGSRVLNGFFMPKTLYHFTSAKVQQELQRRVESKLEVGFMEQELI